MVNKFIINFLLIFLAFNIFTSCAKVRESAGVSRKSPDEFRVIENPPLVIPPNYNLIPPDQLEKRDIENIEKDLAKEILFGLEEKSVLEKNQLSTMNQILSEAKASETLDTIRDEIDKDFSNEINMDKVFDMQWEDEKDVLDAVKESERIRDKIFNKESIADEDVPIKKQKIKNKKKKRFFIF